MQIKDYNGKELNIGDKCLVAESRREGTGRQYVLLEYYITKITATMIYFDVAPVVKYPGHVKVAISWAKDCIIKL